MTKTNITVLGAGLVGFPIALDLSKDETLEITIHDIRKDRLDWIITKDATGRAGTITSLWSCWPRHF